MPNIIAHNTLVRLLLKIPRNMVYEIVHITPSIHSYLRKRNIAAFVPHLSPTVMLADNHGQRRRTDRHGLEHSRYNGLRS